MYSFPVTVLLVFDSALTRRAVGAVLRRAEGVAVVGEADIATPIARMVLSLQPDVILSDEMLSLDSLLVTSPATRQEGKRPQLVVVSTNPAGVRLSPQSGVAAVLPLNLPAEEWSHRLRAAIASANAPQQQQARPVIGMEGRFTVVQRTEAAIPPIAESGADLQLGGPTQPLSTFHRILDEPNQPVRTSRLERRAFPRTQQVLLNATRSPISGSKDATTGLATVRVLDLALLELPRLNLPAAVLMIGVHFQQISPPDLQAATPVLRLVSAILRANVRQGDLVCFLDRLAFAVVMLSVDEDSIVGPLQRIREAMSDIESLGNHEAAPLVAFGAGFWKPGIPLEQTVRAGWQAMLRERGAKP